MRWFLLVVVALLGACQLMPKQQATAVPAATVQEPPLPEWQSPRERDNPRVGSILDLRSGTTITLSQLLVELAQALWFCWVKSMITPITTPYSYGCYSLRARVLRAVW